MDYGSCRSLGDDAIVIPKDEDINGKHAGHT
jgi:hypothetical protein